MNNADVNRSSKAVIRMARDHTEKMRAGARVERRTIVVRGVEHTLDVTVCPISEALGDVTSPTSFDKAAAARRRGNAKSKALAGRKRKPK